MSKYDDKWLDICLLLRELQADGKVSITPANNSGKIKNLRFRLMERETSSETSRVILEVLNLADKFEFFINNGILEISVFVNVFNT